MKCELKYIYRTQKNMVKSMDIKEELRKWKVYMVFIISSLVFGYFTHWITTYIFLGLFLIWLYYDAHQWCKQRKQI